MMSASRLAGNDGRAAEADAKASALVEALPYIRTYRGHKVVVKIGGAALDDPVVSAGVVEDLALMALVGIKLIVVHGGGPQVSQAMEDAGLEPRFIAGLRVTDEAAMEVVRRVLVGSINNELTSRLCGAGLAAVGLSGVDGGLMTARRAAGPDGQDLGRVGEGVEVDPILLLSLLGEGYTPVVASVVGADDGGTLNVNADAVAGAVASSAGASKLIYLTNVEGLYRDFGDSGSLISELSVAELAGIAGEMSAGMLPKAVSAVAALTAGVDKVHILDGRMDHALLLEIFTDRGIGTQVTP